MSARFIKAYYCQHCAVVQIHHSEKYCADCAEEMITWLYQAEQQEQDDIEEQEYIAALEEKQLNFYYEA